MDMLGEKLLNIGFAYVSRVHYFQIPNEPGIFFVMSLITRNESIPKYNEHKILPK